jgi:WD40 repeat protein
LQIWEFVTNEAGRIEPQCVCDLTRHQSSVSAVRWSPDGKLLASADLGEFSKDTNYLIMTQTFSSSVGEIVSLLKLVQCLVHRLENRCVLRHIYNMKIQS